MRDINIAKTIMHRRKEKGITQDELAAYMGVSKASVSKWETGQSYPDITFLPQLAAYFNISIDELIGYKPQMLKEDIKNLYHRLSKEFAQKPFEEVMEKCREIIKKYYACFPLLLQMSILLYNHHMLEKDRDKQVKIIQEVIDLCRHIKSEDTDVWIIQQANSIEAMAQISLGKPDAVLELLDVSQKPVLDNSLLLATAYSMTGNAQKAKETLQTKLYQEIVGFLGTVPSYLMLYTDEPERFEEIIRRSQQLVETFQISELNPGVVLPYYLTAANGYMLSQKTEAALKMLQNYTELCVRMEFPVKLHGDKFFDLLGEWFDQFELGSKGPRDEKTIKDSMRQAVLENPAFEPLKKESGFQRIQSQLDQLKGVTI